AINVVVNHPPVLAAIAPQTVVKTTADTFTAVATDQDGDALTYSLIGAPTGATINAQTGAFSWTPGFDDDGTFAFKVRVTDHGTQTLYDEKTVTTTTTAAGIVNGDLYVVGHNNASDSLQTVTSAGSTAVTVNGASAGTFSGFTRIIFRAGDGDDTITAQGWAGPAVVEGGAGSDTLAASGNASYSLSTSSLTSTDGLSASLDSIESVSLTGSGTTPVTVSGWSGTPLTVSAAGTTTLSAVTGSGDINISATTILVNSPVSSTSGDVTLNAAGDLTVQASASVSGHTVSLDSGGKLTVPQGTVLATNATFVS